MIHVLILITLFCVFQGIQASGVETNIVFFEKIQKEALKGSRGAAGRLAQMYVKGDGLQQNFVEAARWACYGASDQRDVDSQLLLALLYCEGKGVKQSYTRAAFWFEMADHWMKWGGGNEEQIELYNKLVGLLVPAMDALRARAKQGDVDVLLELGIHYFMLCQIPYTVKGALEAAQHYLKAAADQGSIEAGYWYAKIAIRRAYILGGAEKEAKMATSEFIASMTKYADAGYDKAQVLLGTLFRDGGLVEKDLAKASDWYKKAAQVGNIEAEYALGEFALNDENYSEALEWLTKAATPRFSSGGTYAYHDTTYGEYGYGYPEAQYLLGTLYAEGHGVEVDLAVARQWYQSAAFMGVFEAKEALQRLDEQAKAAA